MAREIMKSTHSVTLADVLERVLDKGIIIAGDIKIKLVDIELLTIQLRLMIASVDKAKEMGLDWWTHNPELSSRAHSLPPHEELESIAARLALLEGQVAEAPRSPVAAELDTLKSRLGALEERYR
ncbi:MAG: gas vesicle protein [Candidatus Schekmanbacteria bacterium]|nr:gas vesicle protein [Candidatus Schekmanbacteria bacterium]